GFIFFVLSTTCGAMVIEPDNYSAGTDLSHISPYVTLTTVAGAAVYSSYIHREDENAAGGYSTGELGSHVFSSSKGHNKEWYYWQGVDEDGGLMITFHQPAIYFS